MPSHEEPEPVQAWLVAEANRAIDGGYFHTSRIMDIALLHDYMIRDRCLHGVLSQLVVLHAISCC